MKCNIRPLNKGECFCCSVKKAKEVFEDTEVYLNFSYLGRICNAFAESSESYYLKRNVKGKVIASMIMRVNFSAPILSFYVLKADVFSKSLQEEFETKYLTEFYRLYREQISANSIYPKTILMLVEWIDDTLKLHKATL